MINQKYKTNSLLQILMEKATHQNIIAYIPATLYGTHQYFHFEKF